MGAIADYVHYHQINYEKYGINHINQQSSEKWSDSSSNMINELFQALQIQDLIFQAKKIEKDLNDLYYPEGKGSWTEDNFLSQVEKAANELLEEEFGIAAGKINTETLTVESTVLSRALTKAVESTRKNITITEINHQASVRTINERIQKILKLLEQDAFKNTIELSNQVEKAKQQILNIKTKIAQETDIKIPSIDIDNLNKIILEFNRLSPLANQKGILFEWLIPFINLKSANLAKEELKNQLKKIARSSNKGESYTDINFYDLLSSQNLQVDFRTKKIQMKTASVRNKTDVQIKYKSDEKGLEKTVNISAKNVSKMHVKLVDSTTLYRILSFSNYYNYATHYLNIITASKTGGKASSGDIVEANRITKALILKLAAQGYDANNPAEILIINQGKHISVYNLKALVYILSQAVLQGKTRAGFLKAIPDNFVINQDFEKEGKEKRLNKIIQSIVQVKITAILTSSDLNKYLDLYQS